MFEISFGAPIVTESCLNCDSFLLFTDSPEWVYPTMCNVMQRLFCAASKPDRLYA